MKKFVIYQTVNPFNGHYYFGKATASRVKNGYKGSGVRLKEAFKKYGKENFKTTVLWEFDNEAEAFAKEREIVTIDLVRDPRCYNVQEGGCGGSKGAKYLIKGEDLVRVLPDQVQEYLNQGYKHWRRPHSPETRKKMSESHKGMPGTMKGRHHSEETRKKISEAGKGRKHTEEWKQMMHDKFAGQKRDPEIMRKAVATRRERGNLKHTEEAKRKMSEAHSGKEAWNKGKKGLTPNLFWINNGEKNRRVTLEEQSRLCKEGWKTGRV